MDFLISIWEFFQVNILTRPAFFIGFIVLIGYLLLKRTWYECLAGFIKATVGYLILNVAASGLVSNFRPILVSLKDRFNLTAAVIDPYFGQTAAQSAVESIGRSFSLMMIVLLVAFMFNIVLVLFRKWTKIRTLFITGHIMVQQSATALWIVLFCFPQLQDSGVVCVLGVLLGTYWAVSTNLTVEPCQELTEGGGFAVGHQQMFGIWFADKFAGLIGKRSSKSNKPIKKIEDLELPGFLSMFNDNVVSTSILMTIFFGIIMGILGPDILKSIDTTFTNQSFIFYIIEKSFNFAVYLSILQLGVRMFVAELTESFQGISTRLLPGSVPAVDCAVVYGYGHANAITIGFLFGALGQFLAIIGLIVFKSPVLIIAGFVPLFFDNATFAVFANKKGGLKAAMIVPFVSGLIQVIGGAFAVTFFQLSEFGGWHGNFDFATVWPVIGVLMKFAGFAGLAIVVAGLLAIPQLQYRKNKKHYFTMTEDYEAYINDEENSVLEV